MKNIEKANEGIVGRDEEKDIKRWKEGRLQRNIMKIWRKELTEHSQRRWGWWDK